MLNKLPITFLAVNLVLNMTFGIGAMVHEQAVEHEIKSSFETEIKLDELQSHETELEEIKEIAQEYVDTTPDFKKILIATQPLTIIKNTEEKRALAIIVLPKNGEIPALILEEKQLIKELFQTFKIVKHGDKLVIAFTYQDENLLPETKEQAIYLLIAAYLDQDNAQKESPIEDILNEKQAAALGKKEYKYHPSKSLASQKLTVTNTQVHEGLSGTTRVKTSAGHSALKDLKIGDMVACYDQINKQIVYSPVTHADKIKVEKHISITISGQELKVAPDHQFYVAPLNDWVTAQALLHDANLCSYIDQNIQDVQLVNETLEVTRIRVDPHHNFFITDNNILVHNYIPIVVEVAIAFEIGQGVAVTWAVLAPTAMAIATGLFYWITDKFVHDTPKDLLFTPGPMQDYSDYFSRDTSQNIHYKVENNNQTPQNDIKNSSGGPEPSHDPDKDKNDKDPNPLVNNVIKDLDKGRETSGKTTQYKSKGGHEKALEDFEKLKLSDLKKMNGKEGKLGKLNDGRIVNVRKESSAKCPTLEIYNPSNKKMIKIRYDI